MPILSYLVHARPGRRDSLCRTLEEIPGCEVQPADEGNVVILVTETDSSEAEKAMHARLKEIDDVALLALVFAHDDPAEATRVVPLGSRAAARSEAAGSEAAS